MCVCICQSFAVQDYLFPVFQWLENKDGTKHCIVQSLNGSFSIVDNREICNDNLILERKANYVVYVRTIASELKGADRTIKLNVQGSKGTHEMELNRPVTMYNTFQPGRKDEYFIENVTSLGILKSIELDITHPNIDKLGMDYIEIQDQSTKESYRSID
jgi:hypothetical protein